jgi:hypothetical protein
MMAATQMACALGDKRKAQHYYVDIADADLRKRAADICRGYHIDL